MCLFRPFHSLFYFRNGKNQFRPIRWLLHGRGEKVGGKIPTRLRVYEKDYDMIQSVDKESRQPRWKRRMFVEILSGFGARPYPVDTIGPWQRSRFHHRNGSSPKWIQEYQAHWKSFKINQSQNWALKLKTTFNMIFNYERYVERCKKKIRQEMSVFYSEKVPRNPSGWCDFQIFTITSWPQSKENIQPKTFTSWLPTSMRAATPSRKGRLNSKSKSLIVMTRQQHLSSHVPQTQGK